MKVNSKLFYLMLFLISAFSNASSQVEFEGYVTEINSGPFANNMIFTPIQQKSSDRWRVVLSKELKKPVNFAGHYRIYISSKGEFEKECGAEGWVCGWIIDKLNGKIVSELPEFNGNTAYFSVIENHTPSPDLFYIEFYPNNTMIFIGGENTPKNTKYDLLLDEKKCSYSKYNFINGRFVQITSVNCECGRD